MKNWRRDFYLKDESQIVSEFGKRLFRVMQRSGFTVKDLTNELGTSSSHIYAYFRGDYKPSVTRLALMTQILNCTIAELVGEIND